MLLIDVTRTCHSTAQTGVQRVTRCVAHALEKTGQAQAVVLDARLKTYRGLNSDERALLEWSGDKNPTDRRGSLAPWHRLRQWLRSHNPANVTEPLSTTPSGVFCPEVPTAGHAALYPAVFKKTPGPKLALFYDALPLILPAHTPADTVARFPAYMRELLQFDAIGAISESSKKDLLGYWAWLGETRLPKVRVLPFGFDHGVRVSAKDSVTSLQVIKPPVILCVGTLEGRKNHAALLEAAETLWASGEIFTLRLIGMAHRETGRTAVKTIRRLQASGRPLIWNGPTSDTELEAAYAEAAFTVYPSLMEGFGMPVAESLSRGKPCICSESGALGEVARGGGCLTLSVMDPSSLAAAIKRLLHDKMLHASLAQTATSRIWPTWDDFARELLAWRRELEMRST